MAGQISRRRGHERPPRAHDARHDWRARRSGGHSVVRRPRRLHHLTVWRMERVGVIRDRRDELDSRGMADLMRRIRGDDAAADQADSRDRRSLRAPALDHDASLSPRGVRAAEQARSCPMCAITPAAPRPGHIWNGVGTGSILPPWPRARRPPARGAARRSRPAGARGQAASTAPGPAHAPRASAWLAGPAAPASGAAAPSRPAWIPARFTAVTTAASRPGTSAAAPGRHALMPSALPARKDGPRWAATRDQQ